MNFNIQMQPWVKPIEICDKVTPYISHSLDIAAVFTKHITVKYANVWTYCLTPMQLSVLESQHLLITA